MGFELWLGVVGLAVTVIGSLIAATWVLSNKISDVKDDIQQEISPLKIGLATVTAQVELMMTNHLTHLPAEVADELEKRGR